MPEMFGGWEGDVRDGLPRGGRVAYPPKAVQDDIGDQPAVSPEGGQHEALAGIGSDDPLGHEKEPENAGDREALDKAEVCDERCWIDFEKVDQAPAHPDGNAQVHDRDEDEPRAGRKDAATIPVDRTHGRTSVVYPVGGYCIRPPYRHSTKGIAMHRTSLRIAWTGAAGE